ncbi:hypothetical protein JW905_12295, partial [bacterium]|nr:hypothetical protein [candidate division CSSED10-310 bacterium]
MTASERLGRMFEMLAVALVLLLAVVDPLLFDDKTLRPFREPKEWFALLAMLPICGLWISARLGGAAALYERRLEVTAALLFLTWNILSLAYGTHPALGWFPLVQLTLHLCFGFAVAGLFSTRPRVLLLMPFVLVPGALSAAYSIFQYYGLDPLFNPVKSHYTGRWLAAGFIGQPTLFGAYLGMLIPLTAGLIFAAKKFLPRLLLALTGVLLALALLCTHTRAVMLGIAVT